MLRFIRQVVHEEHDSPTMMMSTQMNVLNSTIDMDPFETSSAGLIDNNNTNLTNGSGFISAISSSGKTQGFPWEFSWNLIMLSTLGLLFVMLLISTSVWYWCNRRHRRHSLPLAVDNFIETRKIPEKHSASNQIINLSTQAPPVPPRPTAYTTILGKVEYRSNL